MYANIDGFSYNEADIDVKERPEIDQWILSELNTLIKEVGESFEDYEPTKAARAIQLFVNDNLSNWYVRLCRRRFWKGEYEQDKISAYQTLYTCLKTIAVLASPIAPFFMDKLFVDLNGVSQKSTLESVHLAQWPRADEALINTDLEEQMRLAQDLTSMAFSLRKKENLRVRQPLQKIMVPVLNEKVKAQVEAVKDLVLAEVNVKELEFMTSDSGILVKKIKPNFKTLGPKFGQQMRAISQAISQFSSEDISSIEEKGNYTLKLENDSIQLELADVEITTEDIPGWAVTSLNGNTLALARELINRIQNIRKDEGFEVTDRINISLSASEKLANAINENLNYICSETLADELRITNSEETQKGSTIELVEGINTNIEIQKI